MCDHVDDKLFIDGDGVDSSDDKTKQTEENVSFQVVVYCPRPSRNEKTIKSGWITCKSKS